MLARMPKGTVQPPICIVRYPDGADTDQLCSDFRQTTVPSPGMANALL